MKRNIRKILIHLHAFRSTVLMYISLPPSLALSPSPSLCHTHALQMKCKELAGIE